MFDSEELAKHCRECRRWSFFLSSIPLKVSTSGSQVIVVGTKPSGVHGKILICIFRYLVVLQIRRTQSLSCSGMQLQGSFMKHHDYLVQCVGFTSTFNQGGCKGQSVISARCIH